MLTGQYPFPDGSAAEKMMAHQFKEPTPVQELNPEVPTELAEVVKRLMKKTPAERYGTCSEVVEALRPHVSAGTTQRAGSLRVQATNGSTAPKPVPAPQGLRSLSPAKPSVSPSTPTPKPAGMGSLPTRNTLRGAAAPEPAPKPAPTPEPARQPGDAVPGHIEGGDEKPTLEERLGTTGIVILAVSACSLVFLVARLLNWF
jgi:serine/threonine-protein kinase